MVAVMYERRTCKGGSVVPSLLGLVLEHARAIVLHQVPLLHGLHVSSSGEVDVITIGEPAGKPWRKKTRLRMCNIVVARDKAKSRVHNVWQSQAGLNMMCARGIGSRTLLA